MASKSTKKGSGKSKAAKKTTTEVEETPAPKKGKQSKDGLQRLLDAEPQANHVAFSEWLVENGGPEIDPKHVQLVVVGYKKYQRSPAAVEAREADREAKAEEKAARAAAREEKAKEREAKAAEREERKAAREKARAEKTEKAASKKTAAASSAPKKGKKGKVDKPTPSASASKGGGKKKAATKKTAAKKAAF